MWCALVAAAPVWWLAPYEAAQAYLPEVERNAAALVRAIDRYVADNGTPPVHLSLLTPRYLSELPRSGFPRCERFDFTVWSVAGEWSWRLDVWCEPLASISIDADSLGFDSRRRAWEYIDR